MLAFFRKKNYGQARERIKEARSLIETFHSISPLKKSTNNAKNVLIAVKDLSTNMTKKLAWLFYFPDVFINWYR